MADVQTLFSLEGKVAVVTGAAGLLGKRHSKALANAGALVVMTDVVSLDRIQTERKRYFSCIPDSNTCCITADITDENSLLELRDRVISTFGRIDILVNNAAVNDTVEERTGGKNEQIKFEEYPLEMWNRSLSVNLTGTFLCSKILGSAMAQQGRGSIINIASTYGMVGPDQSIYQRADGSHMMYKSPAYSATKGGILALTRYLAAYWGSQGIRVNALSPGGTENGQDEFFIKNYSLKTMLKRMALPEEYQGAIVFLASDASSYMTGANLVVDGGWTAW